MARRPTSGRRAGARRGASSSKNTIPLVVGGVALVVLVAILAFAFSGKNDEQDGANDAAPQPTLTSSGRPTGTGTGSGSSSSGSSEPVKDWAAMRAGIPGVDEKWAEIEEIMVEAVQLREEALAIRSESEETFVEKISKAARLFREASGKWENLGFEADRIDKDLWSEAFSRESKKIKRWTANFRGYSRYAN